jgi:PAS domain S-box-containing protein
MTIRAKLTTIILAFTAVPLLSVSGVMFASYRRSLEASRLSHLRDLARIKAAEIETTFARLRTDIEMAQDLYGVKKQYATLFDGKETPADVLARKTLDVQFSKTSEALELTSVWLVNRKGEVVYAGPSDPSPKDVTDLPAELVQVSKTGGNEVRFSDLFLNRGAGNRPVMYVTAPAFGADGTRFGTIVFEADLTSLYRLLQDTTGLGRTGEILFGRRQGDSIQFLSPLKNDSAPGLFKRTVRIGTSNGIPIQKACLGETGAGPTVDYKGKKVVAAWRPIPSLGWGLVTKIDAQEEFAGVMRLGHRLLAALGFILIAASLITFAVARSILRPIKKLCEGTEIIGKGDLDYRVAIGAEDEIGVLSRSFDKMTRDLKAITASRDELNREIVDRKEAEEALRKSRAAALNLMEDAVDARKRAEDREKELYTLNRTLRAHSESSRAMMRAVDEREYLNEVCRIIVEDCGHAMVWIGLAEEDEGKTVRPAAQAGFDKGYVEGLRITWADAERGRGPTGAAIRTGAVVICRNMLTDPAFAPWREEAVKRGYASSLVLPLKWEGKPLGAISIYAREPDAFSEDETDLLSGLADDLSYGMVALRLRAAHAKVEEDLRRTGDYLENLLNHANAPIICWDARFIVTRFNHAFERLAGLPAEEVIGKGLNLLFPEASREESLENIRRTLRGELWDAVEIPILRSDGEVRVALWNSANVYADDGKTLIATIAQGQDITERKQAEEVLKRDKETMESLVEKRTGELLKAQTELAKSKRLSDIGALAATVAHELRNPLAVIRLAVYNIRRKAAAPKIERQMANIEKKVAESDQIINNLLFYSRIKTPQFKPTALYGVLRESVAFSRKHLKKRRVAVSVEIDALKNIRVEADAVQLKEVFDNILANAGDAVPDGTGRVDVAAAVDSGGRVEIRFRDNGSGIPPDHLPKVFEPLFSTKAQGTGLGLSVCRQIVDLHSGRIALQSEVGRGTVVTVDLPPSR